jgi:hypothetical protein
MGPSSQQLGVVPTVSVKYRNESTSSSLQLVLVPTVSVKYRNETQPNSQQLEYGLNSLVSVP